MSLPEALERAASALRGDADRIRPANGDPARLLKDLPEDAAGRVLSWLLAHEPEAGGELAFAWAEREAGAAVLAGVAIESLPKAGRKPLRRALHRLRSRGVELRASERAPVVATVRAGSDESIEAAYLTHIDPAGARIVYLIEPAPGGGARTFEILLDAERGVLECEAYASTRSQARRLMRELGTRQPFPAVAVDPEAARALVARAAAQQPPDRPLPRGFVEARSRLCPPGDPGKTPGELARAALGVPEEPSRERVRAAIERIRAGELGPWPPAPELLREAAERLRGAAQGRIIVSGAQRRERIEAALRERLDALYDEARAERTACGFEETAYLLWKSGSEDDARTCLAAAQEARGHRGGESEVLRALLERALAPVLQALHEEEEEQEKSSLLVKPGGSR